jgi:membrane associated rhomboid family serine protease
VIPIRDANPTQRRPYLTLLLIGLNAAAFLLWEPITGSPQEQGLFFHCYGAIPEEITTFEPLPQVAQACGGKSVVLSIFTSMFLHGGWLHIIGNMLFLWVFGNNVEDRMGHGVFVLFYLVAGIVAAYAQAAASSGSEVPLIGASGAVAGVLGAYLVLYPGARVLTLVFFFFITMIELPAVVVLGLWFVLQAFQGLGSLGGDPVGVAWFAHIGGFAFGAVVALAFYRRQRLRRVPASPLDY